MTPTPIRCAVSGCRWRVDDGTQVQRVKAVAKHYTDRHPSASRLTTVCTAPPYCAWTSRGWTPDELRAAKAEHERVAHALPIRCWIDPGCPWSSSASSELRRDRAWMAHLRTAHPTVRSAR